MPPLGLGLSLMLAAASSTPTIRLASTQFSTTGLSPERASYYSEHFGARLASHPGLTVTTPNDITTLLGIERQRELLGCSDGSCATELAGALGADIVVVGQLANLGQQYQFTVKALSAGGTKIAYIFTSELLPSEAALVSALDSAADELAESLMPNQAPSRPAPWVVLGAGVIITAVGAGLLVDSSVTYAQLDDRSKWPGLTGAQARKMVSDGSTIQTAGFITLGVGAAVMVGSIAWGLLRGPGDATVSFVPTAGGGMFSFAVPLP